MKTLTTREDLMELLEENKSEMLWLHVERTSNKSAPFEVTTNNEIIAKGSLSYELDEENEWVDELTEAVVVECKDCFAGVTEYDSLVAKTRPAAV